MKFPKKLQKKINDRKKLDSFRILSTTSNLIDFSSNDYLGFATSETIFKRAHQYLVDANFIKNGTTGSRLLSGNHKLYNEVEEVLCDFHKSEAALVFNSGYDANIGFFSSVPQKGDLILYDELIHASIRDGIKMSNAKSFRFKHNDLQDLENKISRFTRNDKSESKESFRTNEKNFNHGVYVVTESIFSMDGDSPNLYQLSKICQKNNAYLIVDEAHAIGVFEGGLVQELNLQSAIFARIITFGKAMGCHGAAILGDKKLMEYLINFARSFIYTTGLPPHSLATIKMAYEELKVSHECSKELQENIDYFKLEVRRLRLNFIESNSAIHCLIISGNEKTKDIARKLQAKRFDVKAILSPTVAQGKERLRFCLHSYNSKKEITDVLENLTTFTVE